MHQVPGAGRAALRRVGGSGDGRQRHQTKEFELFQLTFSSISSSSSRSIDSENKLVTTFQELLESVQSHWAQFIQIVLTKNSFAICICRAILLQRPPIA